MTRENKMYDTFKMTTTVGAKIQLYTVGPQDVALHDASPNASFFSPSSTQHTPFLNKTYEVQFMGGGFVFGRTMVADLPLSVFDAMGSIVLEIHLPNLGSPYTWVPRIAECLVRKVRLKFNETVLAEYERLYMHTLDALTCPPSKRHGMSELVGFDNAGLSLSQSHVVYLPLPFAFCQMASRKRTTFLPTASFSNQIPLGRLEVDTEAFFPLVSTEFSYNNIHVTKYISPRELLVSSLPPMVTVTVQGTSKSIGQTGQASFTVSPTPHPSVPTIAADVMVSYSSFTDDDGFFGGPGVGNVAWQTPGLPFEPFGEDGVRMTVLVEGIHVTELERAQMRGQEYQVLVDAVQDVDTPSYFEDTSTRQPLARLSLFLGEANLPVKALVWMAYVSTAPPYYKFLNLHDILLTGELEVQATSRDVKSIDWHTLIYPLRQPNLVVDPGRRWGMYPFALDASLHQPTGQVDLSRTVTSSMSFTRPLETATVPYTLKAFVLMHNVLSTSSQGTIKTNG
jgi:hypothetical protein